MKLIIVDDSKVFRETVRDYLENELKHQVLAEAESGEQFLELPNIMEADVILMDIEMGEIDGIHATKKLLYRLPYAKIIAVTMLLEKVFLEQLLGAGFKGCVFKNDVFIELEKALKEVVSGNLFFSTNIKIA